MYAPKRGFFVSLGLSIGLVVLTLGLLGAMSQTGVARPLGIDVSDPILTHTTWIITDSPYVITNDIVITTGVTLTVEPGVVVQGMSDTRLRVFGHLQAVGTETRPITFTSLADSEAEEWAGVAFEGGTGHLRYVTVRYGGQEYDYGAQKMHSNIMVQDVLTGEVRIENSRVLSETNIFDTDYGLYVKDSHVVVSNTTFAGNGRYLDYGLYADTGSVVTITGSSFEGNRDYPVGVWADGVRRVAGNSFSGNQYDRVHIVGGSVVTVTSLVPQTGLEGYELGGNLVVTRGVTLTVEPGVAVMGGDGSYLAVLGHLQAVGTPTDPITFTSSADEGPEEWAGLVFDGGTGHLRHATVRYGGQSYTYDGQGRRSNIMVLDVLAGEVRIEESQVLNENGSGGDYGLYARDSYVVISGTTFADNGTSSLDYGLYAATGSIVTVAGSTFRNNRGTGVGVDNGHVTMTCTTVASNQVDGVRLANAGSLFVFSSAIEDNAGDGLRNDTSVTVTARYNWWGSSTGPTHASNPGGTGDEVSDHVDFTPWLKKRLCVSTSDADLAITGLTSPGPVAVGDPLTYTFTVTNYGPADAASVTQTYTLPANVSFGGATSSQGDCTGTSTITCDMGPLASNQTATVTILATSTAEGTVTEMAHVTGSEPDPDLSDNGAMIETTVNLVISLAVAQADSSDPVTAGDFLTYTVTTTNDGLTEATGVVLTDALPLSTTFGTAASSQGVDCGESGGIVTCNLAPLAPGSAATVTITVTVDPMARGVITNTVEVTGIGDDFDTDDNRATEMTTVNAKADLAVTKIGKPDPVPVEGSLVYTVTITNNGPSAATGVILTDELPSSVIFGLATSSQGTGCSESGGTVTCSLGALNSTGIAAVTIVVTPTTEGVIHNTARVTSIEPDAYTANNIAPETTSVGQQRTYLPLVLKR
jgi:uncharacterized repeat protein (TIGR01451 family)